MMIRVERLINKCNFMYLDSSKYLVLLSRFGGSSDDLEQMVMHNRKQQKIPAMF